MFCCTACFVAGVSVLRLKSNRLGLSTDGLAVSTPKQRLDKLTRVKIAQVFELLADADKTDGDFQLAAILTTIPPLAVPSSLVRVRPVMSTAALKSLAWEMAF